MNVTIRDVNSKFWRELRIEAVKEGLTIGEAINLALEKWLQEYRKKRDRKQIKSFWDLEPFRYEGEDAGRLSAKIDALLYGWKK